LNYKSFASEKSRKVRRLIRGLQIPRSFDSEESQTRRAKNRWFTLNVVKCSPDGIENGEFTESRFSDFILSEKTPAFMPEMKRILSEDQRTTAARAVGIYFL